MIYRKKWSLASFLLIGCLIFLICYDIIAIKNSIHHTIVVNLKRIFQTLTKPESENMDHSSFWDTINFNKITGTQILQYLMWTNCSSCHLKHDFGGLMRQNPSGLDGQKAICIDANIAPQPKKCIIYSFGIDKDWSFDQAMEEYGCEVYAFDPSIGLGHHDYRPHIHFYDWGLSGQEENNNGEYGDWKMHSLSNIYNKLSENHGNVAIDYLKMDIEQSEWDVLPNIMSSGMLSNVRQLGVEFHLSPYEPINIYRKMVKILRSLELMGMVRFDSKYNPWNAGKFLELNISGFLAYEIAWYNSKHLNDKF